MTTDTPKTTIKKDDIVQIQIRPDGYSTRLYPVIDVQRKNNTDFVLVDLSSPQVTGINADKVRVVKPAHPSVTVETPKPAEEFEEITWKERDIVRDLLPAEYRQYAGYLANVYLSHNHEICSYDDNGGFYHAVKSLPYITTRTEHGRMYAALKPEFVAKIDNAMKPAAMPLNATKTAPDSVQATTVNNGTANDNGGTVEKQNAALLKQLEGMATVFSDFANYVGLEQSALINEIATLLDENWSLFIQLTNERWSLRMEIGKTLLETHTLKNKVGHITEQARKWKQVAKNTVKEAETRERDLITERDACHAIMNDVRNEADKVIPGTSHGLTIDAARKMREEIEALRKQLAAANETIIRLSGSEPDVTGKVAA